MDELRGLFEYNRWANQRFLDALGDLTAEEASREIPSSFPSVVATLAHMVGAEWVWLERWRGSSPRSFPDSASLSSVAAVRSRWDSLWTEQRGFLDGLDSGAATAPISYENMAGTPDTRTLDHLVRHVVNHGSYHRGQLTMMLRQLGRTPPSTDYVRFLREQD